MPKDKRDKLWGKLEADIQSRGNKKDKKFTLKGKWKKFVRMQDGFKVFAVDGTWVRNNLSLIFGHGGHGYVHEFIPLDEIWISTHHYDENKWNNCGCDNIKKNQKVSKAYFDSTVIHEITEFKEMEKGKSYWTAHQIALDKEREIRLLP
ncbi:hypothetical protein KKF04_03310, partial [Patescibacteria group bacterium]|nr:hypothetical protein [Patescibacteria group bacterium]